MKKSSRKKVYVAMSGGVDSSVAAALMVEKGFDVTGVYMKNWSGDDYGLQDNCPWEQDVEDVKKVCTILNIPFKAFNFEKEYRKDVVEYFFREYEAGRTPNPDIMCNKYIKFGRFFDKAIAEGADFIATGHYARVDHREKESILLKGNDSRKDQTYFLYTIAQHQLQKTFFPIGELEKPEVRRLATKFNLPTAKKPDSQGICFIGEIDVQDFLHARFPKRQGNIIDVDSQKVVGAHDGYYFYTLGQRKGLRVGGVENPYFVASIDPHENIVYVANGPDNKALYQNELLLDSVHWIQHIKDTDGVKCEAAIRYRQKPSTAKVYKEQNHFVVRFDTPQRSAAPGQSCVFYSKDICLGGGVITGTR